MNTIIDLSDYMDATNRKERVKKECPYCHKIKEMDSEDICCEECFKELEKINFDLE